MKISPSLICMDFLNVEKQLSALNKLADLYHFDIVDNHFTKTFGLPFEFLKCIQQVVTLPIDVHLMVEDVEIVVDQLISMNVEMITLPIEKIVSNAFRLSKKIKEAEIKLGFAINPITPVENLYSILNIADKISVLTFDPGVAGQQFVEITLTKISKLVEKKNNNNYLFEIEADGSCNEKNFTKMNAAGITQCVVGKSGLFSLSDDIEIAWKKMKNYMDYENIYRE